MSLKKHRQLYFLTRAPLTHGWSNCPRAISAQTPSTSFKELCKHDISSSQYRIIIYRLISSEGFWGLFTTRFSISTPSQTASEPLLTADHQPCWNALAFLEQAASPFWCCLLFFFSSSHYPNNHPLSFLFLSCTHYSMDFLTAHKQCSQQIPAKVTQLCCTKPGSETAEVLGCGLRWVILATQGLFLCLKDPNQLPRQKCTA